MKITAADFFRNTVRAYRFERPDFIPMIFAVNDACWQNYPQEQLLDLMEAHPFLFPDFVRPKTPYVPNFSPVARKDAPYTDSFGCVWHTAEDGITGTVLGHPIAEWEDFKTWNPPDPEHCNGLWELDWQDESRKIRAEKEKSGGYIASLRHGHTFLQLCDIRGYENLMFDMEDGEPELPELIEVLTRFNLALVNKYIALGADVMCYPEDLGMQMGPMLSPKNFRRYIQPAYRRIMAPAREAGLLIHMHSDGDIRLLVDDIIDGGVDCLNLQDLVNGIDWIADRFRGRTCVDLDLDRQVITPFASPDRIDALIREEVEKISTPRGGLTMIYGLYPGVPMENVKAIMDAMERYAFFHD